MSISPDIPSVHRYFPSIHIKLCWCF